MWLTDCAFLFACLIVLCCSHTRRASDLKREADAAVSSSAKATEALRLAQEDIRTAQHTIVQLRAELNSVSH